MTILGKDTPLASDEIKELKPKKTSAKPNPINQRKKHDPGLLKSPHIYLPRGKYE